MGRLHGSVRRDKSRTKLAKWREENPDRTKEQELRATLARHGVTSERFESLLKKQGGVCAICKKPETRRLAGEVVRLSVDHDHSCCTGRRSCGKCVRGLLCHNCNTLLGRADDDLTILRSAVSYWKEIDGGYDAGLN